MNTPILRFCLSVALLLAIVNTMAAQPFGNEWIDYNKRYVKITVTSEGIYRITRAQLQAAGFPVATVDPNKLELFYRGKEVAIRVTGAEDGRFDAQDVIEFYSPGANSDLTFQLFDKPESFTYPFFNWFDVVTHYYLTFSTTDKSGKRITEFSESSSGLSPEIYQIQTLTDAALTGGLQDVRGPLFPTSIVSTTDQGALLSHFIEGNGRVGARFRPAATINNRTYNLTDVKSGEGVNFSPRVHLRVAGRTNNPHDVELFAGFTAATQRSIDRKTFRNYEIADLRAELDTNLRLSEGNNTMLIGFRVNQVINNNEWVAFCYMQMQYPQGFNLQGATSKTHLLRANPQGRSRLDFTNAASGMRYWDITNQFEVRQLNGTITGNRTTVVVPGTQSQRQVFASNQVLAPRSVEAVTFQPIDVADKDYIIITHPNLMRAAGGFPNAAQAYADYRASAAGGSHKPLVVDIFQIYEQFGDGETNLLAVRRFLDYAIKRGRAKYLLLMGKGLPLNNFYYFNRPASLSWTFQNLVPTWGLPGSDHEFSAGLNGFPKHVPALATGRISAKNPLEVINYLNKVKEYETFQYDDLWKKNILHLSGGFTAAENAAFRLFMEGFKRTAEGDALGARVETISKQTTDYVEFIKINDQINRGTGLVTFFGHAGIQYTDIEIGQASVDRFGFRNQGKYPMMIVNGCGSGDIFAQAISLGEDWVLTPNRGAILYLAHGHLGFSGALRAYTQNFYDQVLGNRNNISLPIGVAMQNSLRAYLQNFPGELSVANTQQMILQGDPALYLFKPDKPDYYIADDKVFITSTGGNRNITAQADSFRLGLVVSNFGVTSPIPLTVSVKRTYSDGTTEVLDTRTFAPINYRDTLYIDIVNPVNAQAKIFGLNTFEVMVDSENRIDELNEQNNTARFSYFFLRGNMLTIAPKEYSIVNQQPVFFVAQNSDPFSPERRYRFQLDTAHTFNSPVLKDTTVFGYITAQWTTNLIANTATHDSTVYYWRTKYAEPTADEDTTWAESSFVYIRNSPSGWSQSRSPQFLKNTKEGIRVNMDKRNWEFNNQELRVSVQAVGAASPNWDNYYVDINGERIAFASSCAINGQSRWCDNQSTNDRLLLIAIEGQTGRLYNSFVVDACGASLLTTSIDQCLTFRGPIVVNYINSLKDGDYVIMLNSRTVGFNSWSNATVDALASIGVSPAEFRAGARNLQPVIVIGRKGSSPGSAITRYASTTGTTVPLTQQTINVEHTLRFTPVSGQVTSTLIGPAEEWGNIFRLINRAENPARESWQLDIQGVDFQGRTSPLFSDVKTDGFSLAQVDARQFPYLRLNLRVTDSLNRTPYQLQRWQVIYKEVPEGILLYDTLTYRENTLLEVIEGDSVRIGFNFLNISGNDFKDSLTVEYTILNIPTGRSTTLLEKYPPLKQGQVLRFRTNLNSLNFIGENKLTVFVNPRILPEQIYENNILEARFKVKPDDINPVLDVAVDGRQLMDGDIVSATPLITITLKDENQYLVKSDTAGFEIYLTRDCQRCEPKRIYMNDPNLTWTVTSDNRFVIEYRSEQLEDGTYQLSVQGSDASGNKAGPEPYRVTFRVINETAITNFYPYPNPFSTSVRFVFTLTGEIPDDIRIQIMTVSGKVVRTIHKDELGPLRIGNNMTEFAWDGTDEFGDQLARGVYLYKVDVRKNETNYKKRETARDDLFKHGYGKLYLMR